MAFSSLASNRLRVIIVGTGFAGLAAAIACARQNFAVTVLERSSGLSPHGDSILFGSNASKLLHRWDVGADMYKRGASRGKWIFKTQQGEDIWVEDLDEFPAIYGAPILQGKRASFLGSLGVEARLLGVQIRYESEVVKYWDSAEEPAVVLASGEVVSGDVVIVADGVHSPARHLLASRDRPAVPKRPSGYSIHRAVMTSGAIASDATCADFLDGTIRTWVGDDCHVCTYPMEHGNALAFTFTHRDEQREASLDWRNKKPIAEATEQLDASWDPALRAVLAHFPSTLHWQILDETPETEWISAGGKIGFIGDAVHAMMPTSLQGGSQSIEDAATIALCLAMAGSDPAGVRVALETYESLRRPRVQQAQSLGKQQQDLWHSFASRASSSTSSPPRPSSLRPLSFALYAHDAEHFALVNFPAYAQANDPDFVMQRRWVVEAARNAGIDLAQVPRPPAGGHGSTSESDGPLEVLRERGNGSERAAESTAKVLRTRRSTLLRRRS
ncbi:hypothetical protein Rhopal_007831-T1 [Rhodotorula paludigena]|uniref:FAD-binding domain-containing protein n=1 Tax=Rhodotorula paludigena TaxID=86838 RepID=A0AAV5GXQ5_9BASI|nr:hypothetical protein Rhopal_007831-T1 [Rhodotorula paludigena]